MPTTKRRERKIDVEINPQLCRSCDLCIKFCPEHVLTSKPPLHQAEVANLAACTGCRICEFLCPDWAIFIKIEDAWKDVPA